MKTLKGLIIAAVLLTAVSASAQWTKYPVEPFLPTAGGSVTASYGAEQAPAIAAANWTCGAGWDCSVAGVLNHNADGATAATTNPAMVAVVGTTYRVIVVAPTLTVGSYQISWAGALQPSISAAGTQTYYITAASTATFSIFASATARFTITSISIQALTNGTGDLTVDGNLTVNSPSTFNGPILSTDGTTTRPGIAFQSEDDGTGMGFYRIGSNLLGVTVNGGAKAFFSSAGLTTSALIFDTSNTDTFLLRDNAANTLAIRNAGTAGTPVPQTFNVYNFCDGANCATGYERGGARFSANVFQLFTESAGTGTNRTLELAPGNGVVSTVTLAPKTTDSYDIGNTATAQWRTAYLSRSIQGSKNKVLTDAAAAASFVRIAVPTNGFAAGRVIYTATSTDGTNILVTSASCEFAAADTAGTVTAGTPACDTPATAYKRANTLICTISGAVSTTNYDLQATCTDNLAGSQTVSINYRLDMPQPNTVTPQ